MSSNEEYLDSLLKAALVDNTESSIKEDEKKEEDFDLESVMNNDPNKKLSNEEIAAMFANAHVITESLGVTTVEEDEIIVPDTDENFGDLEELIDLEEITEQEELTDLEEIRDVEEKTDLDVLNNSEEFTNFEESNNLDENNSLENITDEVEELVEIEDISALDFLAQDYEIQQEEVSSERTEDSSQQEVEELAEFEKFLKEAELDSGLGADLDPALDSGLGIDSEEKTISEIEEIDMDDIDSLLGIRDKETTDVKADTEVNGEPDEFDAEDDMSELLAFIESSKTEQNNLESYEDKDVTEILDQLGDDDDELAQINEILKKSDNNEMLSDDVDLLALLDGISPEEEPSDKKVSKKQKEKDVEEEKDYFLTEEDQDDIETESEPVNSKNKKQKNAKKQNNKQNKEQDVEIEDGSEKKVKEKKPNFLQAFFSSLTEEVEEDEEEEKADKPEKKKNKKSNSKKKKNENASDAQKENDAILDELEAEDDKGKKKKTKKAPKTPKKPKKVKEVKESIPEKKLPKKAVIRIFILCFSILALLILCTMLVPSILSLKDARNAFSNKDYKTTYQMLGGEKLNKSDQLIYDKTETILKMQRKYDAYENYKTLGMEPQALNALVEGCALYDSIYEYAASLGIQEEIQQIEEKILAKLQDEYSLSKDDVTKINQLESDVEYSQAIYNIIKKEEAVSSNEVTNESPVIVPEEPLVDPLSEEIE